MLMQHRTSGGWDSSQTRAAVACKQGNRPIQRRQNPEKPLKFNLIDKIEQLSVAKVLAEAIDAVFEDNSVGEIFGGANQN